MKNLTNSIMLFLTISLITVQMACINSSYESARMLKKGETEILGSFDQTIISNDGESESTNNNIGFRVGYGISEKVNLKLRYLRINSRDAEDFNYLTLAPKFQIKENKIAFTTPIGLGFNDGESTWFTSPRLILTHPFSEKFDLSFSSKIDVIFEEDTDSTVGLSLGAGFGKDKNKFSVHPEIGLLFNPGESGTFWSFGVGMNFIIPSRDYKAANMNNR